MNGFSTQFQIAATLVALLIFRLLIWLTDLPRKSVWLALGAGLATAALNIGIDAGASSAGLWWYPVSDQPFAPVPLYIAMHLVFVSALGLCGVRLKLRFGPAAGWAVVASVALLGFLRDLGLSAGTTVMDFGKGPIPRLASFGAWVVMIGLGHTVQWKAVPTRLT